jgi:hypothetical protein
MALASVTGIEARWMSMISAARSTALSILVFFAMLSKD